MNKESHFFYLTIALFNVAKRANLRTCCLFYSILKFFLNHGQAHREARLSIPYLLLFLHLFGKLLINIDCSSTFRQLGLT